MVSLPDGYVLRVCVGARAPQLASELVLRGAAVHQIGMRPRDAGVVGGPAAH